MKFNTEEMILAGAKAIREFCDCGGDCENENEIYLGGEGCTCWKEARVAILAAIEKMDWID